MSPYLWQVSSAKTLGGLRVVVEMGVFSFDANSTPAAPCSRRARWSKAAVAARDPSSCVFNSKSDRLSRRCTAFDRTTRVAHHCWVGRVTAMSSNHASVRLVVQFCVTRTVQSVIRTAMIAPQNPSWLKACRVWLSSMVAVAMLVVALVPAHGCLWDVQPVSASTVSTQPADDGAPAAPDAILVHACTQCACGHFALPTSIAAEIGARLAPLAFHAAHEPPALPAGLVRSDEPPRT